MAESRATQRLRLAMTRAQESGDQDAFLAAAQALHAALERRNPDSADRAQLRADLVAASDVVRSRASSRTGRMLAAHTADSVVGPLLRDVLDDLEEGSRDCAEVLSLAESSRARVLLDALSGCFHGESSDEREPDLDARVLGFKADVDDDAVRQEMRMVSAVRPLLFPEDIAARGTALAELEALYANSDRGFRGGASPVTVELIQERLAPDEVLVEYVIPHQPLHPAMGLAALIITADDATVVNIASPEELGVASSGFIGSIAIDGRAPIDASPLGDVVIEARLDVQSQDVVSAMQAGRRLHQLLVEPVLATGMTTDRDRWIVVPHRQLHPVPWMALVDRAGQPWIATTAVTLAPSASIWSVLGSREPAGMAALALGDPLLSYAGLAALPQAGEEVEHLRHTWTSRGWPVDARTGPAATATALVDRAGEAQVVHLATHGSVPRSHSAGSHQILLGWSPGSPGQVGVKRMRELDLHATWCTTLSVCDGGLYLVGPGDEPLGLVAAALEAGTSSVLAAQWAVADEAGRRLMASVVSHLVDLGPARALRQAALDQARAGAPPREWAAFVCVGSGRGPHLG